MKNSIPKDFIWLSDKCFCLARLAQTKCFGVMTYKLKRHIAETRQDVFNLHQTCDQNKCKTGEGMI